jgi:hypothetical protein
MLYLYLLSWRDKSEQPEYGYYDSCIVAASSEEQAKSTHPDGESSAWDLGTWCAIDEVSCTKIGIAEENVIPGVVLASYNPG